MDESDIIPLAFIKAQNLVDDSIDVLVKNNNVCVKHIPSLKNVILAMLESTEALAFLT